MRGVLCAVGVLLVTAPTATAETAPLTGKDARLFIRHALQVFDEPVKVQRCDRETRYRVTCTVRLPESSCTLRVRARASGGDTVWVGIRSVRCS